MKSRAKCISSIYNALSDLTIAESIILLNEIIREQMAGDINLDIDNVNMNSDSMALIASKMSASEFIFLASAAIDHVATQTLLLNPSVKSLVKENI